MQCVPPSLENKFQQRIKLPEEWAGETKELSNISGVKSAILCHKGRFFARATNFSDIIKMCDIATFENYLDDESNKNIKRKVKK